MHLSNYERSGPLAPKGVVCYYLGIAHHTKDSYYVYRPDKNKVLVRRTIIWRDEDIPYVIYQVNLTEKHLKEDSSTSHGYHLPESLHDAFTGEDRTKWIVAVKKELRECFHRKIFRWSENNKGRIPIKSKIILSIKEDGTFKARWVACGYSQIYGIDYNETFSPTAQFKSLLTLLHIAGVFNYDICYGDVGNAFLETDLDIPITMFPPKDLFRIMGWNEIVLEIMNGLYGLKQSGRLWYELLKNILLENGFEISTYDPCIFQYIQKGKAIWIGIHVDDILIITSDDEIKQWFIKIMETNLKKFTVKEGDTLYYLGMEIIRNRENRTIKITQQAYVIEMLKNIYHLIKRYLHFQSI
jgi:hypothetical protein